MITYPMISRWGQFHQTVLPISQSWDGKKKRLITRPCSAAPTPLLVDLDPEHIIRLQTSHWIISSVILLLTDTFNAAHDSDTEWLFLRCPSLANDGLSQGSNLSYSTSKTVLLPWTILQYVQYQNDWRRCRVDWVFYLFKKYIVPHTEPGKTYCLHLRL